MAQSRSKRLTLKEAFAAQPKSRSGLRCRTCTHLETMPEEDATMLAALLSDKTVSTRIIVESCKAAGYDQLTLGTVKRHRNGDCQT